MAKKMFAALVLLLPILPLTAQQSLQSATEIQDIEPPRLLRAFPDPSGNGLTIEFDLEDPAVIAFQLTDHQGKPVFETPYARRKAFRQTETWATGNVPPGIYSLLIRLDGRKIAECAVIIE